jgi:iron complex transport system ATP-binding protein
MLSVRDLGSLRGRGGRDVSPEVQRREVPLPPNGSGKTTPFDHAGLLPAQAGEVPLRAAGCRLSRPEIARRAHVAACRVLPFRVLDMVVMGRTAHHGLFAAPGREDRAKAMAALDALGIANLAETEYTRISGGQRQLALVARALAQDAPAIVMDEPTASLDFGNQVVVLGEVKRLAARGLRWCSTHDPDHAFQRRQPRGAAGWRPAHRPRAAGRGADAGAPAHRVRGERGRGAPVARPDGVRTRLWGGGITTRKKRFLLGQFLRRGTDFVGLRYQSSYAVSKYAVSKKVAAVGETVSRLDCPGFCAKRFRRDVNSFPAFRRAGGEHEYGE